MEHLLRHVLVARFLLVNIIAIALLVAATIQGWLDSILNAHLVELSWAIFGVFIYGLLLAAWKLFHTSHELHMLRSGRIPSGGDVGLYMSDAASLGGDAGGLHVQALRLKLTERVAGVRHIANALVFLGLIGTVIGFVIALSGVDPEAASNADKVADMVATLIDGMAVALNTTLVGSVLYVWLTINYRVLAGGTVDLLTTAMRAGAHRV